MSIFIFKPINISDEILILVQLPTQPWCALESQRESDPKFDTALNLGTLSLGLSFCLTLITHFYHQTNNEKHIFVILPHNLNSICLFVFFKKGNHCLQLLKPPPKSRLNFYFVYLEQGLIFPGLFTAMVGTRDSQWIFYGKLLYKRGEGSNTTTARSLGKFVHPTQPNTHIYRFELSKSLDLSCPLYI